MQKYILEELINKKINSWTIIRAWRTPKQYILKGICKCDCGTEKEVYLKNILQNKSTQCKSCGLRQRSKLNQDRIPRHLFTKIKGQAKSRKIEFDLLPEDLWRQYLVQNKKCIYTNKLLTFNSRDNKFDGNASLDRIDSTKGYTKNNIQWVLKDINMIKWKLEENKFIDYCTDIVKTNNLKSENSNFLYASIPLRISFLGGGSDYCNFVQEHGGLILGASINQKCLVFARDLPKFFDYKTRLSYSEIEQVKKNKDIKHNYIREIIKYLKLDDIGLEISHHSDMPSKSGVGSSSAFVMGLLYVLKTLKKQPITISELRQETIYVEQNILKECVGLQDATLISLPKANMVEFSKNNTTNIIKVDCNYEELNKHLLLLYIRRNENSASDIAKKYVSNLAKNNYQLKIKSLVIPGYRALENNDLGKFGWLLSKSWEFKKKISSNISNENIENIFNIINQYPILGARLLGAGNGGCILLLAESSIQEKIKEIIEDLATPINISINTYIPQVNFINSNEITLREF